MKVKVISCEDVRYWYSDKVGEEFVVSNTLSNEIQFHVEGVGFLIKADVEVVEGEEKTFPRMMLVSDCADFRDADKAEVFAIIPNVKYGVITKKGEGNHDFSSDEEGGVYFYKHAKEIETPQVEEMTMEEVCVALGKEIKIVK